ncbi:hypothetical protein BS78_K197100 [Paspalum vaginatum]|uniref:Uncharacterized protein n=1 Tax=Paspalum vaginatum TaxID=158149 RepID=A0A9W7XDY5_9POAL|nr:hypothetical protein BS78_K197100 [Paspalum vaginatum]
MIDPSKQYLTPVTYCSGFTTGCSTGTPGEGYWTPDTRRRLQHGVVGAASMSSTIRIPGEAETMRRDQGRTSDGRPFTRPKSIPFHGGPSRYHPCNSYVSLDTFYLII